MVVFYSKAAQTCRGKSRKVEYEFDSKLQDATPYIGPVWKEFYALLHEDTLRVYNEYVTVLRFIFQDHTWVTVVDHRLKGAQGPAFQAEKDFVTFLRSERWKKFLEQMEASKPGVAGFHC